MGAGGSVESAEIQDEQASLGNTGICCVKVVKILDPGNNDKVSVTVKGMDSVFKTKLQKRPEPDVPLFFNAYFVVPVGQKHHSTTPLSPPSASCTTKSIH
jgi:hypothetical protein